MDWKQLNKLLGNIDIYWLDFILKGHIANHDKILDVGCGEGRNLHYLIQNGYDVFGIDQDLDSIQFLKIIAKQAGLNDVEGRFQVMKAEKLLFPNETFDVVVSSAVFHFANEKAHFNKMLEELIRVCKPDGKIFMRTMSDLYLPKDTHSMDENMIQFPEGHQRYVINSEEFLRSWPSLQLLEPYKEVKVNSKHTMATFLLQKKNQ